MLSIVSPFNSMRRRALIAAGFLLVHSHLLPAQESALRHLQAGGASIEDECAALEKQIENAWMSLETLLRDWGRQKQPDLTSESLASDLKALREQVAAKGSAVATDIGTRTLRIQTRIDAVESKLGDFPAETRKRLTEKLANAETRLRGAGKNLDKLGSVCSETEAELIQWRAEFAVNIEIDGADKARDVLRERANSRLQKIEEIRRPPEIVRTQPTQESQPTKQGQPRRGGTALVGSVVPIGPKEPPNLEPAMEDVSAVRQYVLAFLKAGDSDSPQSQLEFYANRVRYFDEGFVNRSHIEGDLHDYQVRWPYRKHEVIGEPRVNRLGAGKFSVRLSTRFIVSDGSAQKLITGENFFELFTDQLAQDGWITAVSINDAEIVEHRIRP